MFRNSEDNPEFNKNHWSYTSQCDLTVKNCEVLKKSPRANYLHAIILVKLQSTFDDFFPSSKLILLVTWLTETEVTSDSLQICTVQKVLMSNVAHWVDWPKTILAEKSEQTWRENCTPFLRSSHNDAWFRLGQSTSVTL